MSETGGMLDAYLVCQALGWEWNLWNMIIVSIAPLLIIGGIFLIVFYVIPYLLTIMDKWSKKR